MYDATFRVISLFRHEKGKGREVGEFRVGLEKLGDCRRGDSQRSGGESGVGMEGQKKMGLVVWGSWWQWGQIGEGASSILYW